MATHSYSYSDQGFFFDGYYVPQKQRTVIDILEIHHGIGTNINYVNIKDNVNLDQEYGFGFYLANIAFSDTLNLSQLAAPTIEARVSDLLELSQDFFRYGYDESFVDQLDFTETIVGDHDLIVRTIIDDVGIQDFFSYIATGKTDLNILDPNVYNAPVNHSLPAKYTQCEPFAYPTISLAELNIRAPLLGNKDNFHKERINIHNRGNELIIFSPTYWPKDSTIELEFDTLTYAQARALSDLVNNNFGKIITIIDHENNTFTGMVLSPDLAFSQSGPGCNYKSAFSFQRFF